MKIHPFVAAGVAVMLSASVAQAQTPPANHPPRIAVATDPSVPPGDFMDMPQAAQLHVNLGPAAGTHNTEKPRPMAAIPSPGSVLALEAVNAAVNSCAADGYNVAAAVTDSAGNLKAAIAPDSTPPNRVYTAIRKDLTVVAFKVPTLALRDKIAADPSLMAQVKPNMALLPGGLPIMKDGKVVGAIAASGATAHEEEKCARAGMQVIQSRL